MVEWKVTEKDRIRLRLLTASASETDRKEVEKIIKVDRLKLDDIDAIKSHLPADVPFFTFLNKLTIHHACNEYKASPEFRAKTEKLRLIQQDRDYKRIVQSVDASQKYGKINHMENFGTEMRTVNRQLMGVVNVIITVVGAFFFGFTGVTYAYPNLNLDLATRFLIGLVLGTIVFFADLYFVIKSMDIDEAEMTKEGSHVLNFKDLKEKPQKKEKSAKEKKND